jgi:hypothetical protein
MGYVGLLPAYVGGWGLVMPPILFRYAMPVVADDVAFAFDVVFAVKPRREILFLLLLAYL